MKGANTRSVEVSTVFFYTCKHTDQYSFTLILILGHKAEIVGVDHAQLYFLLEQTFDDLRVLFFLLFYCIFLSKANFI